MYYYYDYLYTAASRFIFQKMSMSYAAVGSSQYSFCVATAKDGCVEINRVIRATMVITFTVLI
jgi:hypothetical protein